MANSKSFEDSINRSKDILEKLMQPDISLSKSMELYKNGISELDLANKILEEAKLEYSVLNQSQDDELLS